MFDLIIPESSYCIINFLVIVTNSVVNLDKLIWNKSVYEYVYIHFAYTTKSEVYWWLFDFKTFWSYPVVFVDIWQWIRPDCTVSHRCIIEMQRERFWKKVKWAIKTDCHKKRHACRSSPIELGTLHIVQGWICKI